MTQDLATIIAVIALLCGAIALILAFLDLALVLVCLARLEAPNEKLLPTDEKNVYAVPTDRRAPDEGQPPPEELPVKNTAGANRAAAAVSPRSFEQEPRRGLSASSFRSRNPLAKKRQESSRRADQRWGFTEKEEETDIVVAAVPTADAEAVRGDAAEAPIDSNDRT